jgi:hypothetical protein
MTFAVAGILQAAVGFAAAFIPLSAPRVLIRRLL